MRSVFWDYGQNLLNLIDQRQLPGNLALLECRTVEEVVNAIQSMAVRGAPAIGVTAAFGLALAARNSKGSQISEILQDLETASQLIRSSRPTAINLAWGVAQVMDAARNFQGSINELKNAILQKAQAMADQDVETNQRIASHGAALIQDGDTIVHHCNTGSLATVDWGTALGVIRSAHDQGKRVHVLVDETRPLMQGARLTAWELAQYQIPYEIITDSMAGYFLMSGKVNLVLFGADRVAANGDVVNKIGTYMLALAAHANAVPVYSVFPTSTIDLALANGMQVPIEERGQEEVLDVSLHGVKVTPINAKARNPAFDVTPHTLLTGMVTERGIITPPFEPKLIELLK